MFQREWRKERLSMEQTCIEKSLCNFIATCKLYMFQREQKKEELSVDKALLWESIMHLYSYT